MTTASAAASGNALTKGWNEKELQKEVDARVAITQEFSRQAPKAIASYAVDQMTAIDDKISAETDPSKIAELKTERARWDEGGAYRVALHTVSGALTGGVGGAAGAGIVAGSAEYLDRFQKATLDALSAEGVDAGAARMIAQGLAEATSLAAGAAVGGTAGGAAALATDTNNRQLHILEIDKIKELAKKQAKEICRDAECESKAYIVWADLLERVAKGLVDEKENAKNKAYINSLISASLDPQSAGGRGGLVGYLAQISVAESLLSPFSGNAILINGKESVINDERQRYFSATEKQFRNPYINTFISNAPPDSVVARVSQRDSNRIEVFQAINGSATKMYIAEEWLLGGAIVDRGISSLARYWNPFDFGLTREVGISAVASVAEVKVTAELAEAASSINKNVVSSGTKGPAINVSDLMPNLSTRVLTETEARALSGENKGLIYVAEGPKGKAAAQDFQAGTNGAFSDLATGKGAVPALRYTNSNEKGVNFVKFDGIEPQADGSSSMLIDAKTKLAIWSPATQKSVLETLGRVKSAIQQNPGYKVVYEFPNEKVAFQAREFIKVNGFDDIVTTRVRNP